MYWPWPASHWTNVTIRSLLWTKITQTLFFMNLTFWHVFNFSTVIRWKVGDGKTELVNYNWEEWEKILRCRCGVVMPQWRKKRGRRASNEIFLHYNLILFRAHMQWSAYQIHRAISYFERNYRRLLLKRIILTLEFKKTLWHWYTLCGAFIKKWCWIMWHMKWCCTKHSC